MLEVLTASFLLFGAGLFPLLIYKGKEHSSHPYFQFVLSFALSILLGDVFIHLLPEAWNTKSTSIISSFHMKPNSVVLAGIVLFFMLDRLLGNIVGYLTVLANTIDNFLHGLAIAVSFNVSVRMGWLTTCGILLHELPHEVSDYAVLAQCGFTRKQAVAAQLWTCLAGILGSVLGVLYDNSYHCKQVVVPLTAGVFLYVSLTTLIPSLLRSSPRDTLLQLMVMATGLLLTYVIA